MLSSLRYPEIEDVPRVLYDYLGHQAVTTLNRGLINKFQLTVPEQLGVVLTVERELVQRSVAPTDLPQVLQERLQYDAARAKEMAEILWRDFCGPVAWYFPDVEKLVAAAGLNIADTGFAVPQPKIILTEAVDTLLQTVADAPEKIKEQFQKWAEGILRGGEFDLVAVGKKLAASVTQQGFAFSPERANRVLRLLRDYVGAYTIDVAVPTPVTTPGAPEPAPTASAAAVKKISTEIPKDILVSAEKKEVAQAVVLDVDKNISATEQALVEAVLMAAPLTEQGAEMVNRWRALVLSRIKNVRDAAAVQRLLIAPVADGGLALTSAEAERIENILEKTVAGWQNKKNEIVVAEKIASVAARTANLAAGPEGEQKKQQADLNARFVGLFGKKAVEEIRQETHRELMTKEQAHPEEKEMSAVASSPTAVLPTAPPIVAADSKPQYAPKVPDRLKQLIDAEQPFFVRAAVPRVVPPGPKAADIKVGQRVMGPIDELRTMTLVDWRRLSPDASVRTQKIRSKIEVLGTEGATEKLRAIEAVQQSEPVKLYREMLRTSLLRGAGLNDIAAERKTAGQNTLDSTEQQAIRELLDTLKYSSW